MLRPAAAARSTMFRRPAWRCAAFARRTLSSAATAGQARILVSEERDINFHFAVEEFFLNHLEVTGPVLYLWRPAPAVTIGRHQVPWKECKMEQMKADGVGLSRRRSGGGCIFQDLGQSVYTFLAPKDQFSIPKNLDIVLGALRRCGVNGNKTGRNDLEYQGRKISGNAFRFSPHRGVNLHHGTLLVDTDLQALQKYLTPDKRKLEAKGVKSVGARVCNLLGEFPSLSHASICDAFVGEFQEIHGSGADSISVERLDQESDVARDPAFQALLAEFRSDEWCLGRTPEFSHKFDTRVDGVAVFEVQLNVVGGKIAEVAIYSDALFPEVITRCMDVLAGVSYGPDGIRAALQGLRPSFTEDGPRLLLDTLTEWMVAEVSE